MSNLPAGVPVGEPVAEGGAAKADNRAIAAWCLYDFANSSFATVVVTFVYATFFTGAIAANDIEGTALWSRGVAITAVVVALLSPFAGAVADRGGYRKLFLLLTTALTVLGTALLFFPMKGQVLFALTVFVIANIAFELSSVFYNAFLPDIASSDKIGRISGYGWSLGYVGGLLTLVLALAIVLPNSPLHVDSKTHLDVRLTNVLVAVWFALFSIPMFLYVKEDKSQVKSDEPLIASTLAQLKGTFTEIKKYQDIVRFLVARLIYNDGLITIFAFGGIYAKAQFDFSAQKLIYFGIALNVAAALGAFALGFLDDVLGGKTTIQISLVFLAITALVVLLVPNETVFWICGVFVGIFAGPNQSASRSLMGRLVPPDKENEFFGFFAFSGKATAFLGPLLLGILTEAFKSQRAGYSVVVVFFIIGGLILLTVDEKRGMALAARGSAEDEAKGAA